jgi:tripeptidyl-peptidase-1
MFKLLTLATVALARKHMEGQMATSIVEDWNDIGASNPNEKIQLSISMKICPEKRAELEEFFWAVSDPQNPLYGQYKTREQVMEWVASSDEDLAVVLDWLTSNGVTNAKVGNNKDIIIADVPIAQAETMLETEFHSFSSKKYRVHSVDRIVTGYSLPDEVAEVASLVDGIRILPGLRTHSHDGETSTATANWPNYCPGTTKCLGKITPNITAQIYNSAPLTQLPYKVASGNGMAVAEFQTQFFDQKDLDAFTAACGIGQMTVNDVNGNGLQSIGGVETMLDIEYINGNGLGIPLSDYFYFSYSLLNWITQVNGQASTGAPLVYSVSYGNDESQQTSTDYMYQCNTQFMTAGTLGYSVLFASGDQGVWGRSGAVTGHFNPDFPGGSPYITTVGGTDFTSTPTLTSHEEACSVYGGGGFSNTFARPSYQATQVSNYIKIAPNLPAQKYWNATGRAYPDISADFGAVVPYCVLANGIWEGVGGTSASCPTVAHGFAVLNNIQLSAQLPPLGFLNPWIYQVEAAHANAYTDIISGTNNNNIGPGFTAAQGWDPCSGVGTPNFEQMSAYLP